MRQYPNSNMTLEDMLEELALWGIVTLKYLKAWECEVRMPGYLGKNLTSYVKGTGATPRFAAEDAWSKLEEWRASGQMAEDRERYLTQHASQQARYDKADFYQRHGFDPVRAPGKLEPERPLERKYTEARKLDQ